MTYCVGVFLDEGLVFASDTRTNAGVDQVASVEKMHVFDQTNDRVIVLLTAGSLSITQSVVNILQEQIDSDDVQQTIMTAKSMYEVASMVGNAMREVHARDGKSFKTHNINFSASILVGGQIKGEPQRLFNIYAAGNFIEASKETPYLQIGETKYGRPILDRVVKHQTSMQDAVKCVLISFDSTIRSNISVAAPIDLFAYEADSFNSANRERIKQNNPYFVAIREGWSEGLKEVFASLPESDFGLKVKQPE